MIRIPPETDVPLTPRSRRLDRSRPDFRRWRASANSALVSLVYPAAIHTRFEHSPRRVSACAFALYATASHDEGFAGTVRPERPRVLSPPHFLHDLAIGRFAIRSRTSNCRACRATSCSPTVFCLKGKSPTFCGTIGTQSARRGRSAVSEKPRDSTPSAANSPACFRARSTSTKWTTSTATACTRAYLMAGISTSSGCWGSLWSERGGRRGWRLPTRAETAAELMVFARYVMFSEVYWHHARAPRHVSTGVLFAARRFES